jgi:hypothetical protein
MPHLCLCSHVKRFLPFDRGRRLRQPVAGHSDAGRPHGILSGSRDEPQIIKNSDLHNRTIRRDARKRKIPTFPLTWWNTGCKMHSTGMWTRAPIHSSAPLPFSLHSFIPSNALSSLVHVRIFRMIVTYKVGDGISLRTRALQGRSDHPLPVKYLRLGYLATHAN